MSRQPGGENEDPKNMSRADYARNVRRAMDERRERAMANRQRYHPLIHEQVQRLFQNYQPPFYASLRGFGREQTLGLAESTVLALAAGNDRAFSDSETQALTEHFLMGVHNTMIWKWGMTGYAGYMTYKGRATWRFPFFTPRFVRFSPVGGSPVTRMVWQLARFSAYYGAAWVIGEPVFQALNFMRQRNAMVNDPRLQAIMKNKKTDGDGDVFATPEQESGWGSETQGTYSQQSQSNSNQSSEQPSQDSWTYGQSSSRAPSSQPRSQSQQQQQQSNAWDSVNDDFDDASPIATSSRKESSSSYSGSAWDRVRQQSGSSRQPTRGPQDNKQSWGQAQQNSGWAAPDYANSQSQWSSDSSAYGQSNQDTSGAKDQAQRQFDEMLEKERRGTEQERTSWSRK